MKEHRCNASCSSRVTEQNLRDWGYDFPVFDGDKPFAGVTEKVAHQGVVAKVKYQAFLDGKVRPCTRTEYQDRTGDEPEWSKKRVWT